MVGIMKKKLYMNQVKTIITQLMAEKMPELKGAICEELNQAPFRIRLAFAIKLLFGKFGI